MEKRIPYDIFMSVKRVYQACNPLMTKRASVKAKMDKLAEDYKSYDAQIAALEAGIKSVTGFRVEELVKKVVETTDKIDPKTGKPTKTTKFLPTDIVTYDSDKRQYVVTIPDPSAPVRVPEESACTQEEVEVKTEEVKGEQKTVESDSEWGSDFDIDTDRIQEEPKDIEPLDIDIF